MVVTATKSTPKSAPATAPNTAKKRATRSTDERIADFEAKIAALRAREQQRKAKSSPTVKHLSSAVRSVEKALAANDDASLTSPIDDARAGILDLLERLGASASGTSDAPAGRQATADEVLDYVASHDGVRAEEIADGLETDVDGIRAALGELKLGGRVTAEGRARATRYHASASKE